MRARALSQTGITSLRTMEPQRRQIVATIFAAQSLFSAAQIAGFTLMSVIAADLGGSDSYAGLPATLLTFARAGLALPMGIMLDRFGRRNGLSVAYTVAIAGGLIGIFAISQSSFLLFILAAILMGISRGGADQSRFIASEVVSKERQGRVIGLIVFAGTIGAIGGPLLVDPSGKLMESLSIQPEAGGWAVIVILSLLATLSTFVFLRPDPLELSRSEDSSMPEDLRENNLVGRSLREIFSQPRVQLAVFAMLIGQTVMQLLMTITGVYMKHHGHTHHDISLVIMAHTLGMFGLSGLTGYLIDRYGRIPVIVAGAFTLLVSCVIAPLSAEMPILLLSLFLLGLGWNFCFVGGSSMLLDALATSERGHAQGFNETLVALAAGLGSLSSGVLFDVGGFGVVSIVGIIMVLALVGLLVRFNFRPAEALESAI